MNAEFIQDLVNRPLFSRQWAMPNKWTFQMKPVRKLLARYEVGVGWADPFAGQSEWAELSNDLNPTSPAKHHLPALDFLAGLGPGSLAGVVFDPPYSIHQVKQSYDSFGLSVKDNITGGFPKEKNEIARIVRPGGLVISFGWNTVGMGIKRGFKPIEYVILSHGGNRNDTLIVVEAKSDETHDANSPQVA